MRNLLTLLYTQNINNQQRLNTFAPRDITQIERYRWLRYLRKMSEDCYTLVMLRHGESEWTKRNLFCGWYDSKLSENGIKEAHVAGQILRDEGFQFDHVFTSQLSRAQDTVQIILQELGQSPEVTKSWRLNERHYGDLTGYNKLQMANKYGLEQVGEALTGSRK
ncbi:hypothetical protein M8J77_005752 [Diaphorina citri]|nr:hypothetical protein M8J77_005752 [Diaphorina citri]